MKTFHLKGKAIQRGWHLVDAKDKVLGRMASDIAAKLMGKNKVNYSPHLDMGDHVVVINSTSVVVTGQKADQKKYIRHSGYPGGFKEVSYEQMHKLHPERIIEHAVRGMLPDNRLADKRMRRLYVFKDAKHPYEKKI